MPAALHLEMKFLRRKHLPLPSAAYRQCSEASPAQLHVPFSKPCAGEMVLVMNEWNSEGESYFEDNFLLQVLL